MEISIPDSTILVDNNTSALASAKSVMTLSNSSGFICPCAERIEASGTSFVMRSNIFCISFIRGHTTKICPPRCFSRKIASLRMIESHGPTNVLTARRSTGGVAISDISLTPDNAICRVRGMGVADKVRTCMSPRIFLSCSF